MKTLNVSDQTIRYNLKSKLTCGAANVAIPSKRVSHNKTPQNVEEIIKYHINSFPRVDSHYCRSRCKKEFLDASLSIRQMHRLYKDKCSQLNVEPVFEGKYRQILNEQFNLSFHKPKKDLCDSCELYKANQTSLGVLNEDEVVKQMAHEQRKNQARLSKQIDKESKDRVTAVFDLQ